MLAPPRSQICNLRYLPIYIVLFLGIATLLFYHRDTVHSKALSYYHDYTDLHPTNSTLGFGAIYAVSGVRSPRLTYLLQAANVTGIDITVPQQQEWTEEDIANFRRPGLPEESTVGRGSVLAWLSHHVVLREFLASDLETCLIVEDDIDWDIRLKRLQVPLAARTVRSLTGASKQPYPYNDPKEYFYGNPAQWDLLYLGHCGDYMGELLDGTGVGYVYPDNLTHIPHETFHDESLPEPYNLHPFTTSLLTALDIPRKTRIVHKSSFPLCTFGYGITRRTAERLLKEIAPPKENTEVRVMAYDVAILRGCRVHGLRCWTVNPELMHHMEGESLIAIEESSEKKIFKPPVDKAGLQQVKHRGETANIQCGFWDKMFTFGDDMNRLAWLQNEVTAKGRCLKNDRESEWDPI